MEKKRSRFFPVEIRRQRRDLQVGWLAFCGVLVTVAVGVLSKRGTGLPTRDAAPRSTPQKNLFILFLLVRVAGQGFDSATTPDTYIYASR